jgi:hypothetical protein
MKTLETMTRDERSLLLFLETCAVDYGGKVDARHMNDDDFNIAKQWNAEGFIEFGRIKFHDIVEKKTHWVTLSIDAWTLAHTERKERAERLIAKQTFGKVISI